MKTRSWHPQIVGFLKESSKDAEKRGKIALSRKFSNSDVPATVLIDFQGK